MADKKAKAVNFTAEQTAELQTAYEANPSKDTVAAMAEKFGKSTRSIVAKLVNLGIYVKAEKVAADGEAKETKEVIVSDIAKLCNVADETFDSLAGATKKALVALRDALSAKTADVEA